MEEPAPRRHTAAVRALVAREREQDRIGENAPQLVHRGHEVRALPIAGREVPRLVRHGDELDVDHQLAAALRQHPQKLRRRDLFDVLRRHGHGRAKEQIVLVQRVHVGDQLVVDARTPARVGDLPPALDAHDGNEVAALVEKLQVPLVHVGAVGKDREQDALHRARRLNDVPAEHRLAAGEHDEADAQLLRLAEHPEPFLACELLHRLGVHRRLVAARVAARAVQVAAAGDAGDQERRDMLALLRKL